ncbi:DUF2269 family protein [Ruegeria sp. ANG-R]|uniref:DUF2269 family protein n=1 Tax=Ruegeria sp. ANG-R TaxID=1577903 RepID=UPI00187BE4BF|nr:DUF2269 family protein [Ruegeria sp. ANG-R]
MPDLFLSMKLIHILATIVMVGATIVNGVIHAQAKASTPVEAAALLRVVTRINKLFMGPSLLIIPASGLWMMTLLGYDWSTGWLAAAFVLSLGLLLAFVIGDRIERKLRDIATAAADEALTALPASYQTTFSKASPIGGAAFVMSIVALILMIFKPF